MASKRSASTGSPEPSPNAASQPGPEAQNGATDRGPDGGTAVKAEKALALVGMGLMQQMAAEGSLPWVWTAAEDAGRCDVASLRNRLELTDLALGTGAPLSTAEVAFLLGVRPGAEVVERGGLRARRLSRNVWKLAKASGESEVANFSSFRDGRRRFG